MKNLKLLICGSRDFDDINVLTVKCDEIIVECGYDFKEDKIEIVSGTARGSDRNGERYGAINGFEVKRFEADWDTYGRKAGMIRNGQMVDYLSNSACDSLVIAFWDYSSRGTKNTIDRAVNVGIQVAIVNTSTYEIEWR